MQAVADDVFYSIYQYLGFGLIFAVICMIALPEVEHKGLKKCLIHQWHKLRTDKITRYKFAFFTILFMVLSRTLICRNIWQCPWENIIGEWGVFASDGTLNTEGMLNVLLFVPLAYFGVLGFFQQDGLDKEILFNIVKTSFGFSCLIEICQLFLRVGTFQLSDIFQNTLGGFIGVAVWAMQQKIMKRGRKNMNTTLLIMAAGIGSRFGTGIKQLEPVDASNHIIMDYSIHDAIEAGFNHVIFIIRKDIEKEFKEVIGDRIASICSSHNVTVDYAFQDINDIPGALPEGRTKPWGTGQAVLAAKNVIDTPFIVINADDYYGKEAYVKVHEYLVQEQPQDDKIHICMAGFRLGNTLSDNGSVTRGICHIENGALTGVTETHNIFKTAEGAETRSDDGTVEKLDVKSLVSMNMWGLTPDFLDVLEEGFKEFFEKEVPGNPLKAEYLIPIFIGELLEQGKMSVKVLKTNDTWYGMTYHEDVAAVKDSFKKMLENGVYKADLFSDL